MVLALAMYFDNLRPDNLVLDSVLTSLLMLIGPLALEVARVNPQMCDIYSGR